MSAEAFDELMAKVREAEERKTKLSDDVPRFLRTAHESTWKDGELRGKSKIVLSARTSGSYRVGLAPWTVALDAAESETPKVVADDGGNAFLLIDFAEGKNNEVVIPWRRAAQEGSEGRRFLIDLPAAPISEFRLSLPKKFRPNPSDSRFRGPIPSVEEDHWTWILESASNVEIDLIETDEKAAGAQPIRSWAEKSTKIAIGVAGGTMSSDWSIESDLANSSPFRLELSPDIQILDVVGPEILDHEITAEALKPKVLQVRFRDRSDKSRVTFSIKALVNVPVDGPWALPSLRPLDCVLIRGTTEVSVGPSHVVADLKRVGGDRVESKATGASEPLNFSFDDAGSDSAATFTFQSPRSDAAVDIRGELFIGNSAPRFEASLLWKIFKGRRPTLDVDMPLAWVPDSVEFSGGNEPASWSQEIRPGGSVRLHIGVPTADSTETTPLLKISAISTIAGGQGAINLPRVRPVDAGIMDEMWVSNVEDGFSLVPVSADGLAWIDPASWTSFDIELPSQVAESKKLKSTEASTRRRSLAWRRLTPDGGAVVERERFQESTIAGVSELATVTKDQLEILARITIENQPKDSRSFFVGLNQVAQDPSEWKFVDESSGMSLPGELVDAKRRSEAGIAGAGTTWKIEIPPEATSRHSIQLRSMRDRADAGAIPLVMIPGAIARNGVLVLRNSTRLETEFQASGVHYLDAEVAFSNLVRQSPTFFKSDPSLRTTHAFEYDTSSGTIELRSRTLATSDGLGVIEEARLRSSLDSIGPALHRFRLKIARGTANSLSFRIPKRSILLTAKRDGEEVVPRRDGDSYEIPFVSSSSPLSEPVNVHLDFEENRDPADSLIRIAPLSVDFSLPCLRLTWKLDVPQAWQLNDWGASLTNTEDFQDREDNSQAGLFHNLGRLFPQSKKVQRLPTTGPAELLEPSEGRNFEFALKSLLKQWNTAENPILIDKIELDDSKFDLNASLMNRGSRPKTDQEIRAALERFDLTLVQLGRTYLLTSRTAAERFERTGSHLFSDDLAGGRLFNEALNSGSAGGGRFQTLSRVLKEDEGRSERNRSEESSPILNDRGVVIFTASRFPPHEAEVVFQVGSSRRTRIFAALCLAILLGATTYRLAQFHTKAWLALSLFVLGSNLKLFTNRPIDWFGDLALFTSCTVLATALIGRWSFRLPLLQSNASQVATARQPLGSTVTASSIFLLILIGAISACSAALPMDGDPILVLYPFDGLPDPSSKPTRVVLKLADFQRLKTIADEKPPALPNLCDAVSVVHRFHESSSGEIGIESDWTLNLSNVHEAVWSFPIGETRMITAALNGVAIPVAVSDEGKRGRVTIKPLKGDHEFKSRTVNLVLKRQALPRRTESGFALSLPVCSHPNARVQFASEKPNSTPTFLPSIPIAEGRESLTGPSDRIELRWDSPEAAQSNATLGSVDAVLLWDAFPAGDSLKARYVVNHHLGIDRIRLRLGNDVLIKKYQINGNVNVVNAGESSAGLWEGRISPPLPSGSTLEFEFWRPFRDGSPESGRMRTAPDVEIVGIEKQTAILGFRRPKSRQGRLSSDGTPEPLTEEAFLRHWGDLQEEPLTLSGAVRLATKEGRFVWPAVETHPAGPSLSVQSSLRLAAKTGRVDFDLEADLLDTFGNSHDVRLNFPTPIQIIEVSAEGLTSWSSLSDQSLLVRFDGPTVPKRRLRLVGWLAVANDPLRLTSNTSECSIPWPTWPNQMEKPGTLSVTASSEFQLDRSSGAVLVSADRQSAGTASQSLNRAIYRIDDSSKVGTLRWLSEPPKVNVRVRSDLTINPDSAGWAAQLNYDVSGGPLEAIHLKLPKAWARGASVRLLGLSHQQVSESRGETTFWSIRPVRPIWGSIRLSIRSSIPITTSDLVTFPDIVPLGPGSADTHLSLANATRKALAIEGSSGLQPVASIATIPGESSALESMDGSRISYYHVLKAGWSLRVRRPGLSTPDDRFAGESAEIQAEVNAQGNLTGVAEYRIRSVFDPFIAIELPPNSEILQATIDGSILSPFAASPTRRLLAVDSLNDSPIRIVWTTKSTSAGSDVVVFPTVVGRKIPTSIAIRGPSGSVFDAEETIFHRQSAALYNLAASEAMEREIARSLVDIDRGSDEDRQRVVTAIQVFESRLVDAEQVAKVPSQGFQDERDLVSRKSEILRTELESELTLFSLEGLILEAKKNVGEGSSRRGRTSDAARLSEIGRTAYFEGVLSEGDRNHSLKRLQILSKPRPPALPFLAVGLLSILAPGLWGIRLLKPTG